MPGNLPAAPHPGTVRAVDVALRPLRSGNTFEECVGRLLQLVKLGLVAPGQRLPPERELAARLCVSRATLRQALRSLADADWVAVRRGRHGGTFVLPRPAGRPGPRSGQAELEDTLVMREVLEVGAVGVAAASCVPGPAVSELQRMLREGRSVGADRYRRLDSLLHLFVVDLAGSPSLSAAVADVRVRLNDQLEQIPLLARNIEHSNDQHDDIVRAVIAGRPAGARDAMAQHVAASSTLLRGFLT